MHRHLSLARAAAPSSDHASPPFAGDGSSADQAKPKPDVSRAALRAPAGSWLRNAGAILLLLAVTGSLAGCSQREAGAPASPRGTGTAASSRPLVLSAIPDQDPEKLQRLYGKLAGYLSEQLGVPVEYRPVTDYTASVTAFKVGDLDMVWYGGLTGVQARLQVPGAQAILQRDIDEKFHSVFIANAASGINGLGDLKGHTFTFGSESSTSGRLMPQYFLQQKGIALRDFKGEPGFSGNHDKTIALVAAGTYDAGAVNEQVWKKRLKEGTVDTGRLRAIWTTPGYHDYHWVIHPDAIRRYGQDFPQKVKQAFTRLDPKVPEHREILDLFTAERFIPTENGNYRQIEAIGREVGLIVADAGR